MLLDRYTKTPSGKEAFLLKVKRPSDKTDGNPDYNPSSPGFIIPRSGIRSGVSSPQHAVFATKSRLVPVVQCRVDEDSLWEQPTEDFISSKLCRSANANTQICRRLAGCCCRLFASSWRTNFTCAVLLGREGCVNFTFTVNCTFPIPTPVAV